MGGETGSFSWLGTAEVRGTASGIAVICTRFMLYAFPSVLFVALVVASSTLTAANDSRRRSLVLCATHSEVSLPIPPRTRKCGRTGLLRLHSLLNLLVRVRHAATSLSCGKGVGRVRRRRVV